MDGVHDLGGIEGFGPVEAPPSEPVFNEDWERRALRVNIAVLMALQTSGGAFRHKSTVFPQPASLQTCVFVHPSRAAVVSSRRA